MPSGPSSSQTLRAWSMTARGDLTPPQAEVRRRARSVASRAGHLRAQSSTTPTKKRGSYPNGHALVRMIRGNWQRRRGVEGLSELRQGRQGRQERQRDLNARSEAAAARDLQRPGISLAAPHPNLKSWRPWRHWRPWRFSAAIWVVVNSSLAGFRIGTARQLHTSCGAARRAVIARVARLPIARS